MPCLIGYAYMRIEADGKVMACCTSPFSMGDLTTESLEDIWHSHAYYSWRDKFFNIHRTKFHHTDLEFSFCKMCPLLTPNYYLNRVLKIERT
jgi:radical SAM protein with 4Fe4S-binding SPASM domain